MKAFMNYLMLYRPVPYPSRSVNLMLTVSLIVAWPTVFLMPVCISAKRLWQRRRLASAIILLIAILQMLLSPVIIVYALVLALLKHRLYLHSQAAQTISDIQKQARE